MAGRKEKAKAVIRQKGKWFSNRIQITSRIQGEPRPVGYLAPQCWSFLCLLCPQCSRSIYPSIGSGWGEQTQTQFLGIGLAPANVLSASEELGSH